MSDRGKVVWRESRKRWAVRLNWKGKRYYFSSYNGMPCFIKEMANQLLAEIRGEINRKVFNPAKYLKSKPMHLQTYAGAWMERKTGILASNTIHDYNKSLRKYIFPILGDPLLEDINYDMLEDLQKKISRGPKGKKNVMYCLYAIMRDAKRSGYISQLPERPPFTGENAVIPPEIEYIEPVDIDLIMEKIPEEHRSIFTFIRLTGCRTSEARALQWDSIKEDHVEIRLTFGRDQELKIVKNRRPRKIPRYRILDEFIRSLPKTLSPYVFINPKTGRHYGRDFADLWRQAVKDAKLKPVQLRLLRHSFGCNLLNVEDGNIDLEDLRRLYGHADVRMTKRYAERSTRALQLKLDNVFDLKTKRDQSGTTMVPDEKGSNKSSNIKT